MEDLKEKTVERRKISNLEKQIFREYNLKMRSRSVNTKKNHHVILRDIAQLLVNQFKLQNLRNLRQAHIDYVIQQWKLRNYKSGTLATKIGFLRKFCIAIGKKTCIKDNAFYKVRRGKVLFTDKRWTSGGNGDFAIIDKIDSSIHKYADRLRDLLKLQRHFGLRARESGRFWPIQEIKCDQDGVPQRIELTLGTKNGRYRTVPVVTDEQRSFLKNLLITYKTDPIQPFPASEYRRWRRAYFYLLKKINVTDWRSGHGLRQAYANDRLSALKDEIKKKLRD